MIYDSYSNVPSYSWSVFVVTHEFGHLFGSRHTHACVWNGNNTAIDGCSSCMESSNPSVNTCNNCVVPPIPSGGGTIMSYCHLQSAGVNFNLGFGTQPGNVIRNSVENASCLCTCANITTLTGPSLVCTSGATFTLNNAPIGATVTWQLQNGGKGITPSSGTGAAATISIPEFFIQGPRTIIFTINTGCGNIQVQKTFYVGEHATIGITQLNPNPLQTCPLDKYYSVPYLPGVSYQWNVTGPDMTAWFIYGENPGNYQENAIYVLTTSNAPFDISVTMSADGCSATGTLTNQTGNGIYCDCYYDPYVCPEQGGGLFSVYPNPASSTLTIELSDSLFTNQSTMLEESYQLKLISSQSLETVYSTITSEKQVIIPVDKFPDGTYYLSIRYKEAVIQRQIIIRK